MQLAIDSTGCSTSAKRSVLFNRSPISCIICLRVMLCVFVCMCVWVCVWCARGQSPVVTWVISELGSSLAQARDSADDPSKASHT